MEMICCSSKATYFDTQKTNFASNEKNISGNVIDILLNRDRNGHKKILTPCDMQDT